ncbi:hypothetical protein A4G99_19825 [Haladaptatus sp. R4]|uniref:nuclear transport factor 2 family protein n=1 Tax=Haladaptatus sp. R4 TaxID=1679489 RepID=UPI0007B4956E|nr:nuclear transport factor 2 family protein [Haladaptatus sp. R4]KZN22463.1 hypothetical protein A4G99_19825 [Haladaptatus sp. R4]
MNADDAEATVREYYEALREGEPLPPFFAADESLVKFGISERLVGYEAVAEGLRDQTRESEDWTVTSSDLRVTERDRHAWFSDDVHMAWTDIDTDTETGTRREFDTRWSGTLEERDGEWLFVGMHVSAPQQL